MDVLLHVNSTIVHAAFRIGRSRLNRESRHPESIGRPQQLLRSLLECGLCQTGLISKLKTRYLQRSGIHEIHARWLAPPMRLRLIVDG